LINKRRPELVQAFKEAFPHTIPVLTGYFFLGVAYGVLMQSKGYNFVWAGLMSAIAFGGSMQYVAISLLTTAFNPVQACILSFMVNARHMFYGLSMQSKYKGMGKIKNFLIFMLSDETFAVAYMVETPPNINRRYFFFAISFLDYMYWVISSIIGGILGNFISFNTKGLDFVLTALFVVLFVEQLTKKTNWLSGAIGVISTLVSLMIFGQRNFIIPAMVIIVGVLFCVRHKYSSSVETADETKKINIVDTTEETDASDKNVNEGSVD